MKTETCYSLKILCAGFWLQQIQEPVTNANRFFFLFIFYSHPNNSDISILDYIK